MHFIKREGLYIVNYVNTKECPAGYTEVTENDLDLTDFLEQIGDYTEEAKFERNADYKEKRKKEYGSAIEQLEYIVENGLDAFITRQNNIKTQYPKD